GETNERICPGFIILLVFQSIFRRVVNEISYGSCNPFYRVLHSCSIRHFSPSLFHSSLISSCLHCIHMKSCCCQYAKHAAASNSIKNFKLHLFTRQTRTRIIRISINLLLWRRVLFKKNISTFFHMGCHYLIVLQYEDIKSKNYRFIHTVQKIVQTILEVRFKADKRALLCSPKNSSPKVV